MGFGADVSKAEDVSNLLAEVRHAMGVPEILVTNAGVQARYITGQNILVGGGNYSGLM